MKKYQFAILISLLMILIGAVVINTVNARPSMGNGAPTVVSYQGIVTESGSPFTGTGYFKFALVNAAGDTSYWSNDGTSPDGGEPSTSVQVTVADGLFNILLGDTNLTNMNALPASAFNETERYLRIWFSSDGITYDLLSPDQRIAAVPYALQAQEAASAGDADTLDGLDSSEFVTSDHDHDSDYLAIDGTAVDSDRLGDDPASAYFGGGYVADAQGLPLLGAECLHQGGSLLVVARDGSPYCSTAGGTGVFTNTEQTMGSNPSYKIALGDLDGDGDLDAFVANNSMDPAKRNKVWLNDGNGFFRNSEQELPRGYSRGLALGDVDGDGDLDVYVTNSGPNKLWLNNGDGTFTDSAQTLDGSTNHGIALGDLDGDGDLDAFITTVGTGNHVRINNGTGSFTDSTQSLGSGWSEGVALGDVDGDGDLDAFVANSSSNANKVWLNDGNANFTDSTQSLGSSSSYEAYLADLDSDGDLDAYVVNTGNDLLWLNDGTGTFTNSGQSFSTPNSYGGALGDLDGDDDLDVFIANDGADQVWLNDGSGVFTETLQTIGSSSTTRGVDLGDLDGDGDLDAFLAKYGSANQVWINIDDIFLTQDGTAANSDLLNGLEANQLLRVGYGAETDYFEGLTSTHGHIVTATIEAPAAGYLIISAAVDASDFNDYISRFSCEIRVDNIQVPGTKMWAYPDYYIEGSVFMYNDEEDCTTTGVIPVGAGTHTITVYITYGNGVAFWQRSVWALYVPFGSDGTSPSE